MNIKNLFSDEDDDDDDDDTEALMAELERIKKERAEEKLRKVCCFCISIVIFQCGVHLGFGSMIGND